MEALARRDFEALRQAMLVGTARRPLLPPPALAVLSEAGSASSDPTLPLLALTGQHIRFERPVVPAPQALPDSALRLHSDPRPILPEPVRRALFRIVDWVHRDWAIAVVAAAARRVAAAGFRLHPFDLPGLMKFLKSANDELGPSERAFIALSDAVAGRKGSEHRLGDVTADNWHQAPSFARLLFLRHRRTLDPVATRAMIESLFASAPAVVRADILNALAVRASVDDLPLIQRGAADRAETVRAAAASLLARVPGTPLHAERLAAAAACFHHEGGGVASKLLRLVGMAPAATSLTFVPPAGAGGIGVLLATKSLFEGISLPELAAEVGASPRALADALPEGAGVFLTLLGRTAEDGDDTTLKTLALSRLLGGSVYPRAPELSNLASSGVRMSEEAAIEALSSANWRAAVERLVAEGKDDGTLVLTAMMLPPAAMTAFVASLGSPSGASQAAQAFAGLVLALSAANPAAMPSNSRQNEAEWGKGA
jgi:hypothetical protein